MVICLSEFISVAFKHLTGVRVSALAVSLDQSATSPLLVFHNDESYNAFRAAGNQLIYLLMVSCKSYLLERDKISK